MAVASIVACVLIGLLAGSVGGVFIYRQVEYGTPPTWQTEIISRFTVTASGGVTLSSQQFEYQGNAKWTDLYGAGGVSDVGIWSLMIDAEASTIKLEHTRLLTLSIQQLNGATTSYWVLGSVELNNVGFSFQYSGTSISTQTTMQMQLTIDSAYALKTHYAY